MPNRRLIWRGAFVRRCLDFFYKEGSPVFERFLNAPGFVVRNVPVRFKPWNVFFHFCLFLKVLGNLVFAELLGSSFGLLFLKMTFVLNV